MPYSFQEFTRDMSRLREVNSSEWDVVPGPLLEPGMYREYAPQVKPIMRMMNYFVDQYGKERGGDNSYRFMLVNGFLSRHKAKLIKLGITKPPPHDAETLAAFVEFLLDGFVDPTPPVLFSTHLDFTRQHDISFKKAMKRFAMGQATSDR